MGVSGVAELSWWPLPRPGGGGSRYVAYRGWLTGYDGLYLHMGVDGWQHPLYDIPFEHQSDGTAVALLPELDGYTVLDCVVGAGDQWDNNTSANFRLWTELDIVDSHVHAFHEGWGRLGYSSLHAALLSAGIRAAVVSSAGNSMENRTVDTRPRLHRLVWVRPGNPSVHDVRWRLEQGYVGLKLHPSHDNYRADDEGLGPYMELAQEFGCPVAVHSAPHQSDPDLIRRTAERHPGVTFLLYHTYLGHFEGRMRAVNHARQLPNLYLETSWCSANQTHALIDAVGPDRVVFGSDAAVDGAAHYTHDPPNVEGTSTYNDTLLTLARQLDRDTAVKVLGDNARRLFRLPG